MERKFRVALIGCGVISDNHLIPLCENSNVEIVALCDIDIERATKKKISYGLPSRIYSDYVEMLDKEELDSVHIATPHYLHCEMTCEALKRNINVFLEKPMCISTDEIDKILCAERNSSARVSVCFQNRFNLSTLRAKDLIDEDGGVTAAFGSLFWKRDADYYAADAWRGKLATEGGGVMINQAIHTIDLLCYFLGVPEYVCATTANHSLKNIIEVEDTCEGIIYFEGGKRANFYATNSFSGKDFNNLVLFTKNHRIELRYERLFVDDQEIKLELDRVAYMGKACYGNGHKTIIDLFYQSLQNGEEMPVSCEIAQYALRVLLAAYSSSDTKIHV